MVEQAPVQVRRVGPDTFLVDFGRAAFGNLKLIPAKNQPPAPMTVRFGEALKDGRVDSQPPGSVRYSEVKVTPETGGPGSGAEILAAPPADRRNTHPPAVLTRAEWGVLTPFRWVEVEGWPGELRADEIRRRAVFDSTWVEDAASFQSSNHTLDQVWDLCHYSIEATTFAGIFVDGDRERLAYEGDAYLDQLGYYAGDANPRMPRVTFERLLQHPTWPSEWALHMVFIAYADWMQTGDKIWLGAHYESLKTRLLTERVGPDGLVTSTPDQIRKGDLVDWPVFERDGYVFTEVNTVINAFHLRALQKMGELASALGKEDEAAEYREREKKAQMVFQEKLFDPARGLYRDGTGTEHASLHANLFPLAFGMVPPAERARVATWVAGRGMAASVYAAQYLLEGLFENGEDATAIALMTAPGDRSWKHMLDSDATITWEAWDQKYKPNQDWNHAWGAAPANLLPRFVLGLQPLTPGWGRANIQPHPGSLTNAKGTMPTPRGEMAVEWTAGKNFLMKVNLPHEMNARVELPVRSGASRILVNGAPVKATRDGNWWVLQQDVSGDASGNVTIEER